MISTFRRWFNRSQPSTGAGIQCLGETGDGIVRLDDRQFDLNPHADWHEGLPYPDWSKPQHWLERFADDRKAQAWMACERAWVLWLRDALGGGYRVYESPKAFLLTTQGARAAGMMLESVAATFRRVQRVLEDLAQPTDAGKEIVLLFSDEADYYRYISHYYSPGGNYAMSSGMHINSGCAHFAAFGEELHRLEPVIAHEMTHGLLDHLPIPAWLNEGMAVSTEWRLARNADHVYELKELEAKHRRFWTPALIQEFWNGSSYYRPDDGNKLSYDLGRILVTGLSRDWPAFKRFVAQAHIDDAGDAAARSLLNVDLGEFVRHYLSKDEGDWGPRPKRWGRAPERGGF